MYLTNDYSNDTNRWKWNILQSMLIYLCRFSVFQTLMWRGRDGSGMHETNVGISRNINIILTFKGAFRSDEKDLYHAYMILQYVLNILSDFYSSFFVMIVSTLTAYGKVHMIKRFANLYISARTILLLCSHAFHEMLRYIC